MAQQATPKILVVEDSALNQKVILKQLRNLGCQADIAVNGQAALAMLAETNYDIVLMDCQMPVLNGYDATREIRRLEGQDQHTVVIAMTASATEADQEKCAKAGMDGYLNKSVTETELVTLFRRWCPIMFAADEAISPIPGEQTSSISTHTAASPSVEPLESIVALARLNHITRGNVALQIEVLQAFIEDVQADLTATKKAILTQDLVTIQHRAHQIKGASANVGVSSMQAIAGQLEHQTRQGLLEGATGLVVEIEAALERVQSFLSESNVNNLLPWPKF